MRLGMPHSIKIGLAGLLALGLSTSLASADLLNFEDAAFEITSSASIGPDQSFDNDSQSGDLSTGNPFDLSVTSSGSLGIFTTSGSAQQMTSWSGNQISTSGSSLADLLPSSGGEFVWDSTASSTSLFEFSTSADVAYSLSGIITGNTAGYMLLTNESTGAELHSVTAADGSFDFTGILETGFDYSRYQWLAQALMTSLQVMRQALM